MDGAATGFEAWSGHADLTQPHRNKTKATLCRFRPVAVSISLLFPLLPPPTTGHFKLQASNQSIDTEFD
ncbi:hypothetical protein VTG60DRAFT_5891 [Thermothelomyces hinnuleus]